MGLFNLLANTVEGVTEATVNGVKLVVSPVLVIVDPDAPADAVEGVKSGIEKIGKAEPQHPNEEKS